MRRMYRVAWVASLALASGAALSAKTSPAPAAEGPPVNAVWVDHDLQFTYTGFTTHYSCNGLEDKVKYILKQLGARPGFKVSGFGCAVSSGPELMPHVRIRAALPMAATPEVLAELEKTRSTRELAARASGQPSSSVDAATSQFPATWRTVTFEGTPISDIQDGDCELLEQLADHVFKPLGVQVLEGGGLRCVPNQVNINGVQMKVKVLSAPPEAMPAKAVAQR